MYKRQVLTFSNGDDIRIYTQFMDYLDWNPSFNGYAYNYGVVLPDNYNPGQSYPLLLEPHAYGETMITVGRPESDLKFDGWDIIQIHPHDPGSQEGGAVHSWWLAMQQITTTIRKAIFRLQAG